MNSLFRAQRMGHNQNCPLLCESAIRDPAVSSALIYGPFCTLQQFSHNRKEAWPPCFLHSCGYTAFISFKCIMKHPFYAGQNISMNINFFRAIHVQTGALKLARTLEFLGWVSPKFFGKLKISGPGHRLLISKTSIESC